MLCRLGDLGVVAEEADDLGVCLDAEGADEDGNGDLAVLIDPYIEDIVRVGLVLKPCAAVRDHGCRVDALSGLIDLGGIIDAGGTDYLGDDYTLRAVYDEGPVVGHEREIAHEYLTLEKLSGGLVEKTHLHSQRSGIVDIPLLALFDRVFRVGVDAEIDELDAQVAGVVGYRGNVAENLRESFAQKPVVGFLLHLNEVRHLKSFVDLGKAHSDIFAELMGLDHYSNHSIQINKSYL